MNGTALSKWIFPGLLAIIFLCGGAFVQAQETTITGADHSTELWQGKVLTASFRAGMCFGHDGKARGVLILRHSSGQEDVYHLYGTMRNNEFDLSHSSGHFFTGKLTGPGTMEGKVKLSNGMKLNLKGERLQNVRLKASDCAPLR